MLTCPIHLLFIDNIFGCVWEEDGIILSTKIHSNEVRGGSSNRENDVLLSREVERDPSYSQLAGEQQELSHGCGFDISRQD